ncbi:hypothetical protein DU002_04160 [Corallincola holothuriorum]|uniref:DUF4097 domain-containing protein n=1 Tax=Corallincola holothuriorum TaxID=2282215 RepID=A0A368NP61_9GAMM|nr:DUF4097 family beta strand repeat-containing protein [Corallincola holothuriorum]RCU51673.1 hypothetical protein DU002_04160 [Corallincola holothuriorum]
MKLTHQWLAIAVTSLFAWSVCAEPISIEREVTGNEKIEIVVPAGKAEIRASDDNKVVISGTIDPKADGYDFASENGVTTFVIKQSKSGEYSVNDPGSVLTISLPKGSVLSIAGTSFDVDISGFTNRSRINTVSGDVVATQVMGELKIESVSGDLTCMRCDGDISLTTVSGDIEDKQSAGKLALQVVSGDIESDTQATSVKFEAVSGDITADIQQAQQIFMNVVNGDVEAKIRNGEAPEVTIATVNGDADLYLPANTSARVRASAVAGGDIDNQISDDRAIEEEYGSGSSLTTKLGAGAGKIEFTSVNGDLTLKKL